MLLLSNCNYFLTCYVLIDFRLKLLRYNANNIHERFLVFQSIKYTCTAKPNSMVSFKHMLIIELNVEIELHIFLQMSSMHLKIKRAIKICNFEKTENVLILILNSTPLLKETISTEKTWNMLI